MIRAALIASVKYTVVKSDIDDRMRGVGLRKVIEKDKAAGLIPVFVSNITMTSHERHAGSYHRHSTVC